MHEITVSKGQMVGTLSSQWRSRPDDQKFLDLESLEAQVAKWRAESWEEVIPAKRITIENTGHSPENAEGKLVALIRDTAKGDVYAEPTHYGFSAIASAAKAPGGYLRSLPVQLAALNLNYGLRKNGDEDRGVYLMQNGESTLRAITGPKYGRIYDEEVVKAVRQIAGNGTGDTRWKVPGCIDWGGEHGIRYNPEVEITKQSTTLYASDRDLFLFLCDDRNPIEVGTLPSGAPDLMFRGFYVWNSEVGNRTFGLATMYLRGVCQNRCLWGVEGFSELTFRHTHTAPAKFIADALPALQTYTEGSTAKLVTGVAAAKAAIVAKTQEERVEWLADKTALPEKTAAKVVAIGEAEEGKAPESVWDMAMALTAYARQAGQQDHRLDLEMKAGKLLDKVKA